MAHEIRLPWLSIAPFGSPVVPLVNTISARVSAPISCAGSGSARLAWSGSDSIQRIGRPSARADASVWREAMTSLGCVWSTILRPNSTVCRTSIGTATPPAWCDCEEGKAPFGSIDRPDDGSVAGLESRIGQDPGSARDGVGEVSIGRDRGVRKDGRMISAGCAVEALSADRAPGRSACPHGSFGLRRPRRRLALDGRAQRGSLSAPSASGGKWLKITVLTSSVGQALQAGACGGRVVAVEAARGRDPAEAALQACRRRTGSRCAARTGRRCPAV